MSVIQLRQDTAANWTSNNPTLALGEQGYETDTGAIKVGDGSTAWTSLGYLVGKWTAYSPTWTNLTVGAGTTHAGYFRTGDLCIVKAEFLFAVDSSITGNIQFSLPFTGNDPHAMMGGGWSGVIRRPGTFDAPLFSHPGIGADTTKSPPFFAMAASGSYVVGATMSNTVPGTWATGSYMTFGGSYQVA